MNFYVTIRLHVHKRHGMQISAFAKPLFDTGYKTLMGASCGKQYGPPEQTIPGINGIADK